MKKLRRHDWRAHRSIECTICNEMLPSRQDISMHRQAKHRMLRKMVCKFFPDCYDADECLFEHIFISNEENASRWCPRGESCSDQSCLFSENDHRKLDQVLLCKFQASCIRPGCQYRHNVARQAFLGGSPAGGGKR